MLSLVSNLARKCSLIDIGNIASGLSLWRILKSANMLVLLQADVPEFGTLFLGSSASYTHSSATKNWTFSDCWGSVLE